MRLIFLSIYAFLPFSLLGINVPPDSPELVVVIPSYNNGKNNSNMCLKNLQSIFSQTYQNFSVIYVNDCSSDDTAALVENFVHTHHLENKIQVINNTERKGAMRNLYETIHTIEPHKIVVDIDGDDLLANNNVLQKIASIYSNKNIWITCGSTQIFPGSRSFLAHRVSDKIQKSGNFAYYGPQWLPLRTFYAKLFQLIKKEDLFYNGQFFSVTYDRAIMRPMLEMATYKHFQPVREILYLYYVSPISDGRLVPEQQRKCRDYIASKPPYAPVESLF